MDLFILVPPYFVDALLYLILNISFIGVDDLRKSLSLYFTLRFFEFSIRILLACHHVSVGNLTNDLASFNQIENKKRALRCFMWVD